jgi:hypothetical protein
VRVINARLRGGAFARRTTWNTQFSLRFPASSGPLRQAPVHRLTRVIRTGFENFRSVQVCMIDVTAAGTTETLSSTRERIYVPTSRTCLRAVLSRNFDKRSSGPLELVAEHFRKPGPSRVCDAACQSPSDHSRDVEIFDHDDTVALGVSRRFNVQEVFALTPYFSVKTHHAKFGFLSVLGSFLSSRNDSLRMSQPFYGVLVELGVRCELAIGVGDHGSNATIDGDDGKGSRGRYGCLDRTENRGEPLITVATQCANLRLTLKWAMDDSTQVAEFRKTQSRATEPPFFRVGFSYTSESLPFAFPMWSVGKTFETTLPSPVKFNEKLGANISRHIGKPRQIRSKRSKLIDLIESHRISFFRHRKPKQPMLMCEIPKKTQRPLPRNKPRFLGGCRIDTVSKGFVGQHRVDFGCLSRTGHAPGRVEATRGRFTCSILEKLHKKCEAFQ